MNWTAAELNAVLDRGHVTVAGARRVVFGMTEPPAKGGKRKAPKYSIPTLIPADKKQRRKWDYEGTLEHQLLADGVTGIQREYPWLKGRKYRADLAFPSKNLLVEVEGMAHRIKGRFFEDIRKSQDAVLNGWKLLRVSTRQVATGEAAIVVRKALECL